MSFYKCMSFAQRFVVDKHLIFSESCFDDIPHCKKFKLLFIEVIILELLLANRYGTCLYDGSLIQLTTTTYNSQRNENK